jgi:hypothetical protein
MHSLKKEQLKEKFFQETRELVFLTIYLILFLNSLSIYRALILNDDLFNFFHFGYNFIEALLLSKIILLGKMFQLGERYANRSLAIPTIYKATVFSIFVSVFSVLEHFVAGFFEGKHPEAIWKEITDQGINEICGRLLITFLFFILLFSFLELSRVIGEEKIYRLFFRRTHSGGNNISS